MLGEILLFKLGCILNIGFSNEDVDHADIFRPGYNTFVFRIFAETKIVCTFPLVSVWQMPVD